MSTIAYKRTALLLMIFSLFAFLKPEYIHQQSVVLVSHNGLGLEVFMFLQFLCFMFSCVFETQNTKTTLS